MSEAMGPLTFGKKEEQIFLGREIAQHQDYSEDTAIRIDQEVKRIVTRAATSGRTRILTEHRDGARARSPTRCSRDEVLDGEQVRRLAAGGVAGAGGPRAPRRPAHATTRPGAGSGSGRRSSAPLPPIHKPRAAGIALPRGEPARDRGSAAFGEGGCRAHARPTPCPSPAGACLELGARTLVMGVVNVTPDSFAEAAASIDPARALERRCEARGRGRRHPRPRRRVDAARARSRCRRPRSAARSCRCSAALAARRPRADLGRHARRPTSRGPRSTTGRADRERHQRPEV